MTSAACLWWIICISVTHTFIRSDAVEWWIVCATFTSLTHLISIAEGETFPLFLQERWALILSHKEFGKSAFSAIRMRDKCLYGKLHLMARLYHTSYFWVKTSSWCATWAPKCVQNKTLDSKWVTKLQSTGSQMSLLHQESVTSVKSWGEMAVTCLL